MSAIRQELHKGERANYMILASCAVEIQNTTKLTVKTEPFDSMIFFDLVSTPVFSEIDPLYRGFVTIFDIFRPFLDLSRPFRGPVIMSRIYL